PRARDERDETEERVDSENHASDCELGVTPAFSRGRIKQLRAKRATAARPSAAAQCYAAGGVDARRASPVCSTWVNPGAASAARNSPVRTAPWISTASTGGSCEYSP